MECLLRIFLKQTPITQILLWLIQPGREREKDRDAHEGTCKHGTSFAAALVPSHRAAWSDAGARVWKEKRCFTGADATQTCCYPWQTAWAVLWFSSAPRWMKLNEPAWQEMPQSLHALPAETYQTQSQPRVLGISFHSQEMNKNTWENMFFQ